MFLFCLAIANYLFIYLLFLTCSIPLERYLQDLSRDISRAPKILKFQLTNQKNKSAVMKLGQKNRCSFFCIVSPSGCKAAWLATCPLWLLAQNRSINEKIWSPTGGSWFSHQQHLHLTFFQVPGASGRLPWVASNTDETQIIPKAFILPLQIST